MQAIFSIAMVTVCLLWAHAAWAVQPWKGIFFNPMANSDPSHNHALFLNDFDSLARALSARGLNTVVFDMHYWAYHYTCDAKLADLSYSANVGFSSQEAGAMVGIARSYGMKVMVSMQVVTHQNSGVLSRAYPEYMLKEPDWQTGVAYESIDWVEHNGKVYKCSQAHTSSGDNEPGVGTGWSAVWISYNRHLRDPFNAAGEAMLFRMIDELIAAFTINGKEPEGFHIASDEGWNWHEILDCPAACQGKNHAEAFAMAITNVYTYIHSHYPEMKVIMWGDMLDSLWNGGNYLTAGAVNMIPKEIVIADWRYRTGGYGYDPVRGIFPSVQRFSDKGFGVWPSSWMEAPSSAALIWTGNMAEAFGGNIMGHLYTTWFGLVVPQIAQAFHDPSDTSLSVYARGVAHAIDSTAGLIGVAACPQTDCFCGSYPNCLNCNDLDGIYGAEYRDYYCSNGAQAYRVVVFPSDFIAHWDFEGDAGDRRGNHHGVLQNGAAIVADPLRGSVLGLDGADDYVSVADDSLLDMKEALSISLWFLMPETLSQRQTLVGKHYREYELLVYPKGVVHTYSSNGDTAKYDEGIAAVTGEPDWRTEAWHHLVWVMDGARETVYLNGKVIGAAERKTFEGTLPGGHEFDIGRRVGGGLNFKGMIDDVMLFRRVLSGGEVDYLYREQNPQTVVLQTTPSAPHVLEMKVYAFAGGLRFNVRVPVPQEVRIDIFDLRGKRLNTTRTNVRAGLNKISWPFAGKARPAAGVYFVRLKCKSGSMHKAVVLVK